MKCRLLLLVFFIYSSGSIMAQIENRNLFPTPNAASLGLYGQIPIDYFTGLPSIDIPLYEFKSRDLSIPIHLSYHGGGVKASDHASWVGLGWSLQAGGVINRIQNDLPDELIDLDNNLQRGFFYNYNSFSSSGWQSTNKLDTIEANSQNAIINPNSSFEYSRIDLSPDEFQFNFLGMSGSLFMGQDGQWHLKSKQGLHLSVQTEIGPFAVWEPNPVQGASKNWPSVIRNCLTKFILTAADGTKYFFGAEPAAYTYNFGNSGNNVQYFNTNDSASVEFSRMGPGYSTTKGALERDGGTVPVSWYLTKIKSIGGDSIVLNYTRDGYQIMDNTTTFGSYFTCSTCTPVTSYTYGAGDNIYILDGVSLTSITGANGTVLFNKSKATVLDYTPLGNTLTPQNQAWSNSGGGTGLFWQYTDEVFQSNGNSASPQSTFMKLDSISIIDNMGDKLRSFQFNYLDSTNNRLFLNSMLPVGGDGTPTAPYTFSYNNINGLRQVAYNAVDIDHWGYYTAVNPFAGLYFPSTQPTSDSGGAHYYTASYGIVDSTFKAFDSTFNAIYTANRAPVPAVMQYGVLTQITYPTGGNTQFTWEPNSYSKCVNESSTGLDISLQDLGTTILGAGLRVKQISSQASFNSPVLTKTYQYFRIVGENDTISCGVLNSSQPVYVDAYSSSNNFLFRSWSENSIFPNHYTNGSPVTYTNVRETNSDGGFKIYTYSNQDNGYLDRTPVNYYLLSYTNLDPGFQLINMNSLELERGLLLNESMYGANASLLKKTIYQYNSDTTRFNSALRKYSYNRKFSLNGTVINWDDGGFVQFTSGAPTFYTDIVTALNIYIEYPFLQSVVDTNYDQNGANPMVTVTNYTYDTLRNKKTEGFTSSKAELVSKSYNYAADAISGLSTGAQQGQAAMVTAGMYGIPLETISTRSGNQTGHTRVDFQTYTTTNNLIVPANSYGSSYGQPLDSAAHYINFDSKGNILEYITRDGIMTSLDWGYNQAYPTAKVLNAYNTLRTYYVPTPSTKDSTLLWNAGVFTGQQVNFAVTNPGTITLAAGFSQSPGTDTYTFNYTLTGPVNKSGSLCISGSGNACGSTPSSIPFYSMPVGTYTLVVDPNSNYSIGTALTYTYPIIVNVPTNAGSKQYFYDGFEENTNVSVISGTAHTGNMYWGASTYTTSFVPPDNNAYTIEYWNLQGGVWTYNAQTYTQGMSLTGPVDDIRIYPSTAQLSTYTYRPMVGMTSSIDPKGYTSYYTYDGLGRLATVLDKDKNVLRRYCYNYAGQSQSCALNATPPLVTVNASNSTTETFTVNVVNASTNVSYNFSLPPGNALIGEVPAGSYNVYLTPAVIYEPAEYLYEVFSYSQTSYGEVEFGGGLSLTNTLPINISPQPQATVTATNTSTMTFNVICANLNNYLNYDFTLPPGTNLNLGQMPAGTYNVYLTPNTINTLVTYIYKVFTYSQTSYGEVEFGGGLSVPTNLPITITPN